jgi:hypothetical protein
VSYGECQLRFVLLMCDPYHGNVDLVLDLCELLPLLCAIPLIRRRFFNG